MTISLAREHNVRRIAVNTGLTTCNGCGAYRLCRRWKGLWLCEGPAKCYRHRKAVKALKERKENGR